MADIQYDPACMDCRHDAVKDPAGTTWRCNGHVRAERDWLRAKLANVMVEWDHDVEVLTKERNAALTLAEQRGSAYDMTWREVESLREWKDKEEEERGRQYGLRVEAEQATEQAWADVLSALRVAFGEDRPYDESPTELIVQLADERDEARADTEAMQVYGQEQRDRAIAAERERDEARAVNDVREREVAEIMASDLPYARAIRESHENFRLFQEQRELARKATSELDAALSRARETDGAVSEAKERLWDALDRESLGGTYLAARGLRAALSSPPRPETKAPRECGGRCHDAIDSRSPCPECAAEMHGPELVPRPAPPADRCAAGHDWIRRGEGSCGDRYVCLRCGERKP